jgi:hypothetical protein
MTLSIFEITSQDVGKAIGPDPGWLVSLSMVAPPVNEVPDGHLGVWRGSYFALRGERDCRDLYCASPYHGASRLFDWHPASNAWGYEARAIRNGLFPYGGRLVVRSVPKNSRWVVTLSDTDAVVASTIVRRQPPEEPQPQPPPAHVIGAWAARIGAVGGMAMQAVVALLFLRRS